MLDTADGNSRANRIAAPIIAAAGAVWIPKPPCPANQKNPEV
jgi:hypothetical protein